MLPGGATTGTPYEVPPARREGARPAGHVFKPGRYLAGGFDIRAGIVTRVWRLSYNRRYFPRVLGA